MNKALKAETLWNMALILSIVLFVAAAAFLIMPKPTVAAANTRKIRELAKIEAGATATKERNAQVLAQNEQLVWNEDAQTIGARALETVSRLARASGVKLTAFRPQRVVDGGELQQLPYLVLVEGSYPKAVSLLSTIESPSTKLAVNSVQIASSEGTSDKVSASIGVIAFRKKQNEAK